MTARSIHLPRLTGLLAAGVVTCLALTPVDAQRARAGRRAQPKAGPQVASHAWDGSGQAFAGLSEPKRVSLGFEGEAEDVDLIAEQLDLDVLQGSIRKSTWLLETEPGVTPNQLSQILVTLGTFQGTLYAEEDLRADIPDVSGCSAGGGSPPGEVEPQQCTVGFVDGNPTLGEFTQQRALKQINATQAQRIPRSYTPVVAVIDTGIDPSHPVFDGRLHSQGWDFVLDQPRGWEQTDGLDNDGDGLVDEAYGHGTHIAGTVLAVDPWATILPIRAMDSDGGGYAFDISLAIFYAVDHGADIINLSLSVQKPTESLVSALQYAEAMGTVVFTSAGNTGNTVLFPATYDASEHEVLLPVLAGAVLDGEEIIAVAAVDEFDVKASFSAWGEDVDLSAPGVAVYSAYPGNQYAWYSGTSMATAIASGAAALMLGIGGPWPLIQSGELLEDNADPIDDLNPQFEGGLGAGRLDALAAGLDAFLPIQR